MQRDGRANEARQQSVATCLEVNVALCHELDLLRRSAELRVALGCRWGVAGSEAMVYLVLENDLGTA